MPVFSRYGFIVSFALPSGEQKTASTGNLKFLYTDYESDDEAVINYTAKFNGGTNEGNEEEEDSLSALKTIEKLTFDLYAGSYADDSEVNNRHIG